MHSRIRWIGIISFLALVISGSSSFGILLNLPYGTLTPGFGITTRVGTFDHAVLYHPVPSSLPGSLPAGFQGRGVFILDLNSARGHVNVARVFKSTGNRLADEALVAALQTWRVKPRIIYKLYVPVTVTAPGKFSFGTPE